jgi:hypothetical protein
MPASFPVWNEDQNKAFFRQYEAWENKVMSTFKWAKRENYTGQVLDLGNILRSLPKRQRENLLLEHRKLLGFDAAVNAKNVKWIGPEATAGSIARLKVGQKLRSSILGPQANPQAVLLNNMAIQYNASTGSFGFGSNIPTAKYARSLWEDSRGRAISPNRNMLVWDTETTGLMHESGIRQISAINVRTGVGPNGTTLNVASDMAHDIHFRTARMQWGYLADKGADTRQMNQVIEKMMPGVAYANAVPGAGDDYANALIPFLEQLRDSHYIAGQNIKFDIDQVLVGLTKSGVYHQNPMVRSLVEDVRKSLSDPSKIRDTLARSKAVLPNLGVAPELKWAGEKRTHSLENILLQTNLAHLIREDVGGDDAFRSMFKIDSGGALHAADIDTRLTAYLAKFLYETDADGSLRLKPQRLGGDSTMRSLRRMTLKSSAYTPMTQITDISHIDRNVFNRMVEETRAGGDSVRIMHPKYSPQTHTADELWNVLNKPDAPFARFRMTPLEQEIIKERSIINPTPGVAGEDLITSLGHWRNFAKSEVTNKGVLNKMQDLFKRGIRPPKEEFDVMRRSMAEAGLPFAGLSQPERWMTHAMALSGTKESDLSRLLDGTLESRIARISDDIGVSRFAAQKVARITNSGKNISLPLSVLQAAHEEGHIGPIGGAQGGLGLSAFEYDGGRQVNLVHAFGSQEEASSLASWLNSKGLDDPIGGMDKTLRQLGFDPRSLQDVVGALPGAGFENGITVGYLNGQAGHMAYEAVESINSGLVSDQVALPFRAGLLPGATGYDGDVIRVGAFRSERLATMADHEAYKAGLPLASDLLGKLEDLAIKKPGFFAAASQMVDYAPNNFVKTALQAADTAGKHLTLVGGVSAALGLSYYINKRRKSQNEYDASLRPQGIQTSSDYAKYRQDLGLPSAPARSNLDFLLTAGVVGNSDRMKTGHTKMGNSKYNHLFGA